MLEEITTKKFSTLESYLNQIVNEKKVAGLSLLLFKNNKIEFLQNFGKRNIEKNLPIDNETIYRIYSMSKPITSVGLMMLFEKGLFKLEDPISNYLPEFKEIEVFHKEEEGKIFTKKAKRAITILDLFTHTSGISYGFEYEKIMFKLYQKTFPTQKAKEMNLERFVKELSTIPLRFQPGSHFRYGWSIDVLGRLIEVLTGKTLDVYFKEKIFDPLRMNETSFNIDESKIERFANWYFYTEKNGLILNKEQSANERFRTTKLFSGGGGLLSTMSDYFNFSKMLLFNGMFEENQLLKPETVKLISKNHLMENKTISEIAIDNMWIKHPLLKDYGQGLGVRTKIREGLIPTAVDEYGWSGLAGTFFWIDPKNNSLGIFLTQYGTKEQKPSFNLFKILTLANEALNKK